VLIVKLANDVIVSLSWWVPHKNVRYLKIWKGLPISPTLSTFTFNYYCNWL